jgi:hypothetical protein
MNFPVYDDERGRLLPVELDHVPFPVRRVFVVQAPEGGAHRGDHEADCQELIVLVAGIAVVHVSRPSEASTPFHLGEPGSSAAVEAGSHVRYQLDEGATILVLASEPYRSPESR